MSIGICDPQRIGAIDAAQAGNAQKNPCRLYSAGTLLGVGFDSDRQSSAGDVGLICRFESNFINEGDHHAWSKYWWCNSGLAKLTIRFCLCREPAFHDSSQSFLLPNTVRGELFGPGGSPKPSTGNLLRVFENCNIRLRSRIVQLILRHFYFLAWKRFED